MIIKKIKLKNIRSYESAEVIFPEGSTVLAGDIGSGKTSILLAIEFALFGLQPGQKGSSLLKNGKDEGLVTLEIEVEGKNIIIERGLKRGKSINQSSAKINIEGEKQEMSVTELKNKVLELLNYPKEFAKKTNLLYRFTVYTPQEEMKQIILETSEIRLDTLRHIFGIDKYKRIKENTEIFTIKLREMAREYEGQIKDLEDTKNKLENKKQDLKKLEENLFKLSQEVEKRKEARIQGEKEIEEADKKIKEKDKYEQEVEKTKIMWSGKREILANIEKEKILLEKQVEEAKKTTFEQDKIFQLETRIKEKGEEIENKNKSYMDIFSKIKSLNSKIYEDEKLKSQISSLQLCPTCLQNVDEDYKKNIKRKFEEDIAKNKKETLLLNTDKEKTIQEMDKLNQEFISSKKELDELKLLKIKLENIKEKEIKLEDLEKQKNSALKDIQLLEKQIETLKESFFLLKKYENIYKQKKSALDELLALEKNKEIESASVKKEKELTLTIIKELDKEIEDKEKIKSKMIKITELEDWLSDNFISIINLTERNIMLKLREEFSKLFNEWFNILVPEIFNVRLDEDFTPIIEQQNYSLDYSFLSGGERTAVALAYRLALNQVINSLLSRIKTRDIVILDEPTDGFSEQQLDKMRDILNELKVKQLIIVSHESKIESFVENIIKFKKEDGITRVEA